MFLAPCTLPLVPAFIASLVPGKQDTLNQYRQRVLLRTMLFTIGFTCIFVLFGFVTGMFGSQIAHYKLLLSQGGGVILILFGLALLQVFQLPLFQKSVTPAQKIHLQKFGSFAPLVLGIVFALGWTPCAGPILASILLLASGTGTVLQGGILLFVFSMGLAVPFILVGIFLGSTAKLLKLYERFHTVINRVSGIFLITLGIFLVFGQFILVTSWGFALYSFFGYMPMCTLL
jgi:cytochrome c-type biogenesis protein